MPAATLSKKKVRFIAFYPPFLLPVWGGATPALYHTGEIRKTMAWVIFPSRWVSFPAKTPDKNKEWPHTSKKGGSPSPSEGRNL